jgi:hypothetical protein
MFARMFLILPIFFLLLPFHCGSMFFYPLGLGLVNFITVIAFTSLSLVVIVVAGNATGSNGDDGGCPGSYRHSAADILDCRSPTGPNPANPIAAPIYAAAIVHPSLDKRSVCNMRRRRLINVWRLLLSCASTRGVVTAGEQESSFFKTVHGLDQILASSSSCCYCCCRTYYSYIVIYHYYYCHQRRTLWVFKESVFDP